MEPTIENQLVHRKETIYFALVLLFSILTYLFLTFSIIGLFVIAFIIFFSVVLHGLYVGGIRRNGVRLSEEQFPELYQKAMVVAKDMGLSKIPDIYVMESEGMLNAFATRFFMKDMVVLYSGIFDLIEKNGEKEVLFVLAHEFAHLKRKHVLISLLILPAMWVPFLGNAYLRACEYTCDRYATYYIQSLEAATNGLLMLAIGKELYSKVNHEVYMKQLQTEAGFFVWLNEKLSTHPHLPKRVYELKKCYAPETTIELKEPKGRVWLGLGVSVLAVFIVGAGLFFTVKAVEKLDLFSDLAMEIEGTTPLMNAAMDNDVDKIHSLIEDGVDINEVDSDGTTALHWAVSYANYEAAEDLLEKGADPNTIDTYETTPLMSAVFSDDVEMVKLLLAHGADPTVKDSTGATAYDYAVEYENEEIIKLLEME
ncbi:M48 family metallopeptidase [Robertmurraya andreesenii]|uniref:Zn-dependent protease with chaperone function n=1 Tax=Anoxybacillus andreesenii TaxID=1325932 RepID=A0ABT9V6L1_9BACL|nr:M48 family metallopeptidase [Robertmurraya andreesenii]MDQ0156592.1 Zn-dependent protease with chaperone function [Robertmurraya andreesenii]